MPTPKQTAASRANGALSKGPVSPTQVMLIETMAVARWRQLRAWGLRKVVMDREIALQDHAVGTPEVRAALAFKASSDSVQPNLILRYDIAL